MSLSPSKNQITIIGSRSLRYETRLRRKSLRKHTDLLSSIIAVHGLNPQNKKTYAYETWTASNGKLWLRDFLPHKLPNARILVFGWNSNVAFDTATSDLRDHAYNLLGYLALQRRRCPERPIIFVAHSLGGLVVKKALVEAMLDPTNYGTIRKATYGIAFFGTPHRGSPHAPFGSIVAEIVRFVKIQPSNTLMKSLKRSSVLANELSKDYRSQLGSFHVLSFLEQKKTKNGFVCDLSRATERCPDQSVYNHLPSLVQQRRGQPCFASYSQSTGCLSSLAIDTFPQS